MKSIKKINEVKNGYELLQLGNSINLEIQRKTLIHAKTTHIELLHLENSIPTRGISIEV